MRVIGPLLYGNGQRVVNWRPPTASGWRGEENSFEDDGNGGGGRDALGVVDAISTAYGQLVGRLDMPQAGWNACNFVRVPEAVDQGGDADHGRWRRSLKSGRY